MSSAGPSEAIAAINACVELSAKEKADVTVLATLTVPIAQAIVATPAANRTAVIRGFLASSHSTGGAAAAREIGLTPAPAAVQAWWGALASAQYTPPAASVAEVLAADGSVTTPARPADLLGVLDLPANISWFLKKELGGKLLVRSCYDDFWQILKPLYSQAQNPATRTSSRFIFTGVPGIGKSCDGLYMVYKFLMDWNEQREAYNKAAAAGAAPPNPLPDLVIVFLCTQGSDEHPGAAYYRFRASRVTLASGANAGEATFEATLTTSFDAVRADLGKHSTIYVVDGSENKCEICSAFTLYILSARAAKFKHLYHYLETARAYIQPPWLYKEIEELRAKSAFASILAEDFVLALFDKWGGVPRAVLAEPALRIRELQGGRAPASPALVASVLPPRDWGDLSTAISASDVVAVMSWVRKLHDVGKGVDEAVSYKVLHIHPASGVGGIDYQQATVTFASTWVADQCVKRFLTGQREQLLAWLVAGRDDAALAATAGHLMQGIFHNFIRENPPRQFHRQLLLDAQGNVPVPPAAVEEITFPLSAAALDAASNERRELVFATNAQLGGAASEVLLRAEPSNYPSIESLIQLPVSVGPPAMSSSLFQVTASMNHPLKVEHLKAVIANSQPGRAHPYHVYFCVPQHNFASFGPQPYLVAGAVVAPGQPNWPAVRGAPMQLLQYKLSIPIASELLPLSSSAQVVSKVTGRGAKGRRRDDEDEDSGSSSGAAAGVQKDAAAAAGRSTRARKGGKG